MRIAFASRKLERQLSTEMALRKAFGDRASRLKMRLDLLAVATCLADIPATPPTRRHALTGSWAGHFAVDVTANWRLVFRPAPDLVRVHDDGSLDLTSVTGIEIVAIEDYH